MRDQRGGIARPPARWSRTGERHRDPKYQRRTGQIQVVVCTVLAVALPWLYFTRS
jgi:hypothetical protein